MWNEIDLKYPCEDVTEDIRMQFNKWLNKEDEVINEEFDCPDKNIFDKFFPTQVIFHDG